MNFKLTTCFLLVCLFFTMACRKEDLNKLESVNKTLELSPAKQAVASEVRQRLQLITLVSMDIFEKNPDLKMQAFSIIQQNRKIGRDEALYFKDIVKYSAKVPRAFAEQFLSEFGRRLESGKFGFADRVTNELQKIREKGKIANQESHRRIFKVNDWNFDWVLLAHIGSYIHFPYSEMFEQVSNPQIHYTFDPLNPNAQQTEVYWQTGSQPNSKWQYGNESWAMQNATWVFLLDDIIAGNHLDRYELSPCANGSFLGYLCENELDQTSDFGIRQDSVPPPTPPNVNYNGPLQDNIPASAHATITDDIYLLSATIPRIRIKGNVRPGGFWNASNRITMYRGKVQIANPTNRNFSNAILATSLTVFEKNITRSNGRNKNWVDCGAVYTNQWKQEQFDNYIAVTYVAHWLYFDGSKINFDASASVRYDSTAQTWVPQLNANGKVKSIIYVRKREKLLGEIYLSRASFIEKAIGNNFALGTCSVTGASLCDRQWAVRSIGSKFEYFLRVQITY